MSYAELFGYLASVVVALSLMMKNIVRLRWWNMAGALMFSAYGLLIEAWPVFVLNGWIAIVDFYYLYRMANKRDFFDILDIDDFKGPLVSLFIDQFEEDITSFFPRFKRENLSDCKGLLILRNLLPVGLFLYETDPENRIVIHVDYVVPDYRDLHSAKFLLAAKKPELKAGGRDILVTYSNHPDHRKYLRKLGFEKTAESLYGEQEYIMKLE